MNADNLESAGEPALTIELVPSTCWYTNVRSNVPAAEWDILRRAVYAALRSAVRFVGAEARPTRSSVTKSGPTTT